MPNRLAQSASLYLRKHADNPIDWWPWCDTALNQAKQDNKPIFLSIGYSSCHWCTVMEGEAFSNAAIAEYMNTHFLPIKVDREERPDLDSIYMQSLQMMTGQGGWPLNIFLSPEDLVPFYAGTYFPVEPRYGRPGFLQVLQSLRRYYDTEPDKLQAVKDQILTALQQSTLLPHAAELGQDLLRDGLLTSAKIIAAGSFGNSFPMIPYAETVLRAARFGWDSDLDLAAIAQQRGINLALGGIFDAVAGGFHRYTVDPTWTVPHFEKMLYDNGQIVEYLANLWSAGIQEPAFERAIGLTVAWLQREMTAPSGYFYAAQDADSLPHAEAAEPEEGDFYVWSYPELQELLSPEELTALTEQFTVTPMGNFEGKNVLQSRYPGIPSPPTQAALQTLFRVRYGSHPDELALFPPARTNQEARTTPWPGRIPPVTDTKMIVAWNSLMISGLARAYGVLGHREALALALRSVHFILEHQWVNARLHRLNYEGQVSVLAQSEDYALLIKALLDLHQALLSQSGETSTGACQPHPEPAFFLEQAVRVQTELDDYLWSVEQAGYYNTAKDSSQDLLIRERSYADNATPSANGIAASNLVRLALLTKDLDYLDRAEQILLAFARVMERSPQACPSLFTALDWYRNATLIQTQPPHLSVLLGQYLPTAVCQGVSDLPEGAIALVCQGLKCLAPAMTEGQLAEQIQRCLSRQG